MVEGFLIVIVLFGAPILLVIRAWSLPAIVQNPIIWRAGWRFVCSFILALYYGLFPFFIAPCIQLYPFLRPDQVPEPYFIVLLIALASLFIALAAQQVNYVNRVDDFRRKAIEGKASEAELTAVYFLISCGFWAFSFAVITTFGLIWAYLRIIRKVSTSQHFIIGSFDSGDLFILGIYEAIIAVLFIGGWIILLASALRRFGTSKRTGV